MNEVDAGQEKEEGEEGKEGKEGEEDERVLCSHTHACTCKLTCVMSDLYQVEKRQLCIAPGAGAAFSAGAPSKPLEADSTISIATLGTLRPAPKMRAPASSSC